MRSMILLREVGRKDAAEVGSKAATLGELIQAGLRVPDGFVVTAGAVASLSDEVVRRIEEAVTGLGDGPLAVRSSGIAEDLAGASYAGQYESVLGVRGADAVMEAIRHVRASVETERVATYQRELRVAGGATGEPMAAPLVSSMAVIVQRLVPARAAGAAFTVDPVSGDPDHVLVSAVRGLGERLVSGGADADEWTVHAGTASCRRHVEGAIRAEEALEVAALARRVEAISGAAQDIEWALASDGLWLLQARPIVSAPAAPVDWTAPAGAWSRDFRLGEWLGGPLSPLFESWLLERIEDGFARSFQEMFGFPVLLPHHTIVNGWYFATLDFIPSGPLAMIRTLVRYVLPRFIRRPRWMSVALPPLAGFGVELHTRDWRERILPAYRATVADAEARVDGAPLEDLGGLIDALGDAAGRYFASMTIVAGFAWKAELPLAEWLRKQLPGTSHLPLLVGLGAPPTPPHAVTTLDWVQPTLGELGITGTPARAGLADERARAEDAVRSALPARARRRFDQLLARAQRFARIREEQVGELTAPWPALRRAVRRLGAAVVERGRLDKWDDVFFLTRAELIAELAGSSADLRAASRERRVRWKQQGRLSPPLILGEVPPMVRAFGDRVAALHDRTGGSDVVQGLGASPGRVAGRVRVIRGPDEFDRLADGEVLVAPAITPAWTPLLSRAAAVVTDTGSILAHGSVVAREYGIPAVVGAVGATTRLHDGQQVTVDGAAGTVTPAR